jgi:competence protein ComEA
LRVAGQLRPDAAVAWVDQQLNRAAKVSDGMKIFIPTEKDLSTSHNSDLENPVVESVTSHNMEMAVVEQPVAGGQLISINQGSAAELESLSGIGPVTAQAVISGRPYQSVHDLVNKKVIKPSLFEKIKSRLSL